MKLKFVSVLLLTMMFSCKAGKHYSNEIDINKFVKRHNKEGFLTKDPLIILDGKVLGLLSDIDLKKYGINKISSNEKFIPKGFTFFTNYWGKSSQNGIIIIGSTSLLDCGNATRTIYLYDDKMISSKEWFKTPKEEINFGIVVNDFFIDFDGFIEFNIFTSKSFIRNNNKF